MCPSQRALRKVIGVEDPGPSQYYPPLFPSCHWDPTSESWSPSLRCLGKSNEVKGTERHPVYFPGCSTLQVGLKPHSHLLLQLPEGFQTTSRQEGTGKCLKLPSHSHARKSLGLKAGPSIVPACLNRVSILGYPWIRDSPRATSHNFSPQTRECSMSLFKPGNQCFQTPGTDGSGRDPLNAPIYLKC